MIQAITGCKNLNINPEAIKAIEILDDLDIYYKLGELVKVPMTVPVKLSEENRNKYAR